TSMRGKCLKASQGPGPSRRLRRKSRPSREEPAGYAPTASVACVTEVGSEREWSWERKGQAGRQMPERTRQGCDPRRILRKPAVMLTALLSTDWPALLPL